MASLEVPLADPAGSPVHVSAEYYYRIPVRPIYKSYPVYAPGQEPPGYEEWLKQQEPQTVFDAAKLKTEADWIKAGEIVFDAPISYDVLVRAAEVRDPAWYEKTGARAAKDGTLPWFRYVVREKGKVELGTLSCAMCHTRVMPDGTVVKGAQGNFPFEQAAELFAKQSFTPERLRIFERAFFGVPWIKPDPLAGLEQMSFEQIIEWHAAIPPGVLARHGTSPLYPAQVPDLIGVKDRKYLDHTGLQLHRSAADMMRYAALNQGADFLASHGGFIPGARDFRTRPDPSTRSRYSDEQLYALTLYLYSLKPPANPNKFDALAERGQKVFEREGCAVCHTPPLYTNNKLTPVDGFTIPAEHLKKYDILPLSVGTDPALALKTRRGTGYYKVPSLKGVWYRGPFEHSGSVATLEDWFDPRRLRDDYAPTGFRGAGVKTRAVKGHAFGLNLSAADRQALIAFLKTL
ncbi:MAG TPA: di-heme oxidoredictase family protein [Blastocatellia bacterium]|nr:di-heme oxidoredictase family protein [Blastocatellia bacterium]